MIGLVACGHTFGGVQNVAFPTIVDPSTDPNNTSGNAHFDSTFTHFDNKVYVSLVGLLSTCWLMYGFTE